MIKGEKAIDLKIIKVLVVYEAIGRISIMSVWHYDVLPQCHEMAHLPVFKSLFPQIDGLKCYVKHFENQSGRHNESSVRQDFATVELPCFIMRHGHGCNFVAESGGNNSQIYSQATQRFVYFGTFCPMSS